MDFDLDETQRDLKALASEVLGKEAAQARIEEHERSGRPYAEGIWTALAGSGLLGACLPEEAGGAGLGPVELAVILREAGAHVAPVPLLPSLVAALAVARHGTPEQKSALAPLADGRAVLSYGYREPGADPATGPAATATPDGSGWRLDGRKSAIPYAAQATRVAVTAAAPDGPGLFLVAPQAARVHPEPTATGEPSGTLALDATPAERVGGPEAAGDLRDLALAGITAAASGVLAAALALTTEHIRNRRQFGRALAEFQAVTVQIADVYIAGRALDVAVWSGAWRLANGLPATGDLGVAALHVTEPVLQALHTCQHLHGGLGLDVTYPLHRYFAWGKRLAHLLGGSAAQLDLIGAHA
ncbi:hypothetical protein HNP84_002364 [Thermocatellispora tengchongensis]|uniref:Acyl-CoA dehydrogenase n=1 Tax=Thermocatellispora tengchongensis TaxID=1073253 RepID=A0A840NYS8_9ACTN|nr:acyl-CoA dehydrogenase family protein [Thermocatellispora tengchongensis]MBB5132648.1 hypothetical protein [Thermocatellispora tengchongensis]